MKNVHERLVDGSVDDVWTLVETLATSDDRLWPHDAWPLVETLATSDDRLWPHDAWPAMELDRGLVVGSHGGHADVRYHVDSITPGSSLVLRFEPPTGLDGVHRFDLEPAGDATRIRHTIDATPTGSMRGAWPLAVRWIHDAVVEDAFDNVEAALRDEVVKRRRPNAYVRQPLRVMVPHRPDRVGRLSGKGAAIVLGGIGGLHLAWALGSSFPSSDPRSLAGAVVGGDTFPSAASSATVAGLLGVATAIVAARSSPRSRLGRRLPSVIARPGVVVIGTVLALRGAGGLVVSALGVPSTSSTFRTLNLIAYSPLCIALAASIARLERSAPPSVEG